METKYICTNPDCYHGDDSQPWQGWLEDAEYVVLTPAYDYGHNDCAPEEGEYDCPGCGSELEEMVKCHSCGEWVSETDRVGGECSYCRSHPVEESITKSNLHPLFAGLLSDFVQGIRRAHKGGVK
jgi:hypothetical protein